MNKQQKIKNRTIVFRADSGPSIGMGHFIRTLALAEMLNQHFHCVYVTRKPTDYQIREIEKVCNKRIDLPDDNSHFEQFLSLLQGDEIVVLDNYYFETGYQRAIKAKGCKLVCIDDIHDKHYVADIVINHAPLNKDLFSTAVYTRLLIGFNFALLRNNFLQEQTSTEFPHKLKNVFLCIGGADFNNLTSKILDDLLEINQIETITIVVGNAYLFYNNLVEKVNNKSIKKNIQLYKNLSAVELINQMKNSDFAIVPCSTVLLETISQKLPILTGYYVDNQKEIANHLKNQYKNIMILGDLNTTSIRKEHIKNLENSIETPYAPSIDKNIKERYISSFLSLANEFDIKIRKAGMKDVATFFNWANNDAVRANAINQQKIEYNNHVKWFKSKIKNKDSFLYIFENKNIAVGQVRFDKSEKYYIVDYSVDEIFRGRGYGKIILKLGLEQLLKDCKYNMNYVIKAQVKVANNASCRVFENFNFVNTGMIELKNNSFVEYEKVVL
jgi:UDP-2,4-diacetamido-2,4,6-trideoxy-beta-L-altropyranose hydrolase